METQTQTENKKKKRKVPVVWIVIGAIVLVLAAVVLSVFFKLNGMRRNSTGFVPMPSQLPIDEIEPANLIPVENPDELDLSEDYDPDITDMPLGDDDIFRVDAIDKDVVNILLLGNDARDEFDHGRTDTILVLSYNRKTREAKLVSFLRDTWIYIPGRDRWNRINTAFRFGGVGLTINTINYNFGLDIQYYMRVDFNNMKIVVDAMGGVDLELTTREIEFINLGLSEADKLPVTPGWHHLNGVQTLRHCRNRKIGNGDWSRTERQRIVMNALLNQAKKIRDIPTMTSLIYSLMNNVETNMTPYQLVSLGIDALFGGDLKLMNRAMPFEGTWQYAWEGRMAVIHIDIPANRAKLHEYLYGTN